MAKAEAEKFEIRDSEGQQRTMDDGTGERVEKLQNMMVFINIPHVIFREFIIYQSTE